MAKAKGRHAKVSATSKSGSNSKKRGKISTKKVINRKRPADNNSDSNNETTSEEQEYPRKRKRVNDVADEEVELGEINNKEPEEIEEDEQVNFVQLEYRILALTWIKGKRP